MTITAPFTCRYSRTALGQLRMCPKREQIVNLVQFISTDPFKMNPAVKSLTGNPDSFRRRFGGWRVSYRIDANTRDLRVFEITERTGANL
jgi:mRNA-degrading endonuclease RelE of RelBE toxin-antitoxin system